LAVDSTWIFTSAELASVLTDLRRRSRRCDRGINARCNLTLFRLSCCCGLRCKEICGLNLEDVIASGPRPCIRVSRWITKGTEQKRKARTVPLWLDLGTLADLTAWKESRVAAGAKPDDPFLCSVNAKTQGQRLDRRLCFRRWRTAIRILGKERVAQVSIHKGRHNYISYMIAAGVPLPAVRDFAGHQNIKTTDVYLHAMPVEALNNVFDRYNPCQAK
jgi:integrase